MKWSKERVNDQLQLKFHPTERNFNLFSFGLNQLCFLLSVCPTAIHLCLICCSLSGHDQRLLACFFYGFSNKNELFHVLTLRSNRATFLVKQTMPLHCIDFSFEINQYYCLPVADFKKGLFSACFISIKWRWRSFLYGLKGKCIPTYKCKH